MKPREFIQEMEDFILSNYDFGWAVRGEEPLLTVFGREAGQFVMLGDVVWSPVATPRQKLESAVTLFEAIRETIPAILHSPMGYKKFYERLCDRKLLRRIGTAFDLDGEKFSVFQTRLG